MPLTPGSRLGPYEVVAPLGAGGMGEVYRARDTKLGREVAIKVLPPAFASDPERLARFEREAKVLASLSHPNIAAIFGLHEENGTGFLAMELVAGEDLAKILERGPLPLGEAADVARQIAEALEAAHEQGIVHRDLKPANVRITPDAKVKVLDFGLAKALESATTSDPGRDAGMSPTVTSLGTVAGVILGTAAYMAPEQARGKGVDKRADIWAFGCVLFEMLSGRRPFDGETISDTLAAVLAKDPEWSALPASTPARIRHLLERCLEKDPKRRLRDIGDARLELEEALADRTASGRLRAPAVEAAPARSRGAILGMAACLLVGGLIGAFAIPRKPAPARGVIHLDLDLPAGVSFGNYGISQDGTTIGLAGRPRASGDAPSMSRIFVRRIDAGILREVPGTEGADGFGFIADGRSIAAAVPVTPGSPQRTLTSFRLDGSAPPLQVCPFNPRWTSLAALRDGGFIALEDGTELVRARPRTGQLDAPVKLDVGGEKGPLTLAGTSLPGDEAVLLHAVSYGEKGWYYRLGVLELRSGRVTFLMDDGGNPRYVPTGHIVFTRGDTLLAVPFDAKGLKLTGTPVPIANGLRTTYAFQPALFELSDDGVLVYEPGGRTGEGRRLGVVDAAGHVTPVSDESRAFQSVFADPTPGRRFVATITNGHGIDELFAGRLDEAGLRRVLAIPDADLFTPVIARDGHTIVFGRRGRSAEDGLYVGDLDDPSTPRRIVVLPPDDVRSTVEAIVPDGSGIIVMRQGSDQKGDLYFAAIPPTGGPPPELKPLVTGPADESRAALSPDGRTLAYLSDESGRRELYLAPFTGRGVGPSIRATRGGVGYATWSPDGKSIRYREIGDRVFSLPVTTSPSISVGTPVVLFDAGKSNLLVQNHFSDGRELVIMRGTEETDDVRKLSVVIGFQDELLSKMKAAR